MLTRVAVADMYPPEHRARGLARVLTGSLFGIGLGWNIAFLAATAEAAGQTRPEERGKVFGLSDLVSGLTGATLAVLGGLAFTKIGMGGLSTAAAVISLAPVMGILYNRKK